MEVEIILQSRRVRALREDNKMETETKQIIKESPTTTAQIETLPVAPEASHTAVVPILAPTEQESKPEAIQPKQGRVAVVF